MEETLDQISPILPIDFVSLKLDLIHKNGALKKKHMLPHFAHLLYEDPFADVLMGWDKEGLHFEIEIKKKFEDSFFPNYARGESVELFIDTRDLKSAGFPTKFCHHFLFLPKPVDGVFAEEITTFRTDDRHDLCDPSKLECATAFGAKSFRMQIFIPTACLEGYDPSALDRLGFAYRINRSGGAAQHLAPSSDYLSIQTQPSLWPSMLMRKQ